MIDLDEPLPDVATVGAMAIRRMTIESLPALAQAMKPTSAAEIETRFIAGRRCYAALVEGRLAAYGWISIGSEYVGELRLQLNLLPGEAYIWDCATLPAYRNRHLYSALLIHMLKVLRSGPYCRAWIGTDVENVISQKGIQRAGFHHVADLVLSRVLVMRQVWVEGQTGAPEPVVAEAKRVFLGDRNKVWLSAVRVRV